MQSNPTIPWQRFWCRLGSTIDCGQDGRGFLSDPESEFGSHQNPNLRTLNSLVPAIGPLILCGEPGIGKTSELAQLHRELNADQSPNPSILRLNARQHVGDMAELREHTVKTDRWRQWRQGNHVLTFMLDAVDEGRVRIPALVSQMAGMLENEPIERLRLILTCRSAEWPHEMGRQLLALWNLADAEHKPLYELCPLRRIDVEQAAEIHGLPTSAFMSALWEKQIVGMATRPVTLLFLLDEFRANNAFPATRQQLYERGVRKLCSEIDPHRIEILRSLRKTESVVTLDQRVMAAQYIAATTLCSGCFSISLEDKVTPQPVEGCFPVSACSSEHGQPSLLALEEAVESALFTSVGERLHGFAHLTFAECLAAQALGRLPLRQVRSLLLQSDETGEHVIPQLGELAAWAACCNKDFCRHLLRVDPVDLLRCDAALLPDDLKSSLIDAILEGADSGKILDDYTHYTFFHTLRHPSIFTQLTPWIGEKNRSADARSIAIEIAERCQISELSDILWKVVRDDSDPARENAAEALCMVLPDHRVPELVVLIQNAPETDPDQSILAWSLGRLIPSHWRIRDALPYLLPRRNDSFFGSYHALLEHKLPSMLEEQDVVPVLQWIKADPRCLDSLSSRQKLAKRAVHAAIFRLNEPDVAEALCSLWLSLVDKYHVDNLAGQEDIQKMLLENVELKRQLITLLLNNLGDANSARRYMLLGHTRLLNEPEDLDWLLEEISLVDPENRRAWANIIQSMCWDDRLLVPNWDKFLSRVERVPELAERFEWLRAWDLDAPEARKAKADWLRNKWRDAKWEKKIKDRKHDATPYRVEALSRIRSGDSDGWYALWHVLHWGLEDQQAKHLWCIAVEQFPGWKLLNAEERALATRGAYLFLSQRVEESKTWGRNSKAAMAGACAVWLLREELAKNKSLRELVSQAWTRMCANIRTDSDKDALSLFALVYKIAPDQTLNALRESLEENRTSHRHLFAVRHAKECWDQRLSDFMAEYLRAIRDPSAIRSGIEEWTAFDSNSAAAFACSWLDAAKPHDECYPISLRNALVSALMLQAEAVFDDVFPLLRHDKELALSVWCEVLSDYGLRKRAWHHGMSELQLGAVYEHLTQVLPKESVASEDGTFSNEDEAVRGRANLLGVIAAKGTLAACNELARLAQLFPQKRGIAWNYHAALNNKRRNAWSRPGPEEVSIMLKNAKSRLVQSEQDLVELVLESLERFQQRLTNRMLPAVDELWKWNGASNQRTDFTPKDEEALSGSIARWLFEDIGPESGVVVNCEVQPKRGSRTDIQVEAVAKVPGSDFERLTVVIEVKGCWHPDVRVGMHTQLVDGYLKDLGLRTGIYVVGWFVCDRWEKPLNHLKLASLQEARAWLDTEVARYDGRQNQESVKGVVLNCAWPLGTPSGRAKLSNLAP